MPYPNRTQWVILWCTVIVAFYLWDQGGLFRALGSFDEYGYWLGWVWLHRNVSKAVALALILGLLAVWQFSRPRQAVPAAIPLLLIASCLVWFAVGASRSHSARSGDELDHLLQQLPAKSH